ncbi:MAG: hypothetical protein J5654_08710 [Victivallales bacterium]|nr:hypothetical protein [Victivallales bacterium]
MADSTPRISRALVAGELVKLARRLTASPREKFPFYIVAIRDNPQLGEYFMGGYTGEAYKNKNDISVRYDNGRYLSKFSLIPNNEGIYRCYDRDSSLYGSAMKVGFDNLQKAISYVKKRSDVRRPENALKGLH